MYVSDTVDKEYVNAWLTNYYYRYFYGLTEDFDTDNFDYDKYEAKCMKSFKKKFLDNVIEIISTYDFIDKYTNDPETIMENYECDCYPSNFVYHVEKNLIKDVYKYFRYCGFIQNYTCILSKKEFKDIDTVNFDKHRDINDGWVSINGTDFSSGFGWRFSESRQIINFVDMIDYIEGNISLEDISEDYGQFEHYLPFLQQAYKDTKAKAV